MPKLNALIVLASLVGLTGCGATAESQEAPHETAAAQEMRVIRLAHADAQEMADTLAQFIADDPGSTAKVRADAATNSVLVAGSEPQIDQIMNLIARLDVER